MIFTGQTEEKWGLCFAGGGGKGAYEIGVWRALEEFTSIKFQAVAGASVGALNAALLATMDARRAEEIWMSIRPDMLLSVKEEAIKEFLKYILLKKIVHVPMQSMVMGMNVKVDTVLQILDKFPFNSPLVQYILKEGIFSREGLEEIIVSSGVLSEIGKSSIECFASVCDVQGMKSKVRYLKLNDMKQEDIIDTLLASSALPLVYGKQNVDGREYRDGGLKDNLPIEPLYGCGCTRIIVIHLGNPDSERKGSKVRTVDQYQGMLSWNIYPRKDLKGIFGTLDFAPKTIQKLIAYGYDDMKYFLENSEMRLTHIP